MTAFGLSFIPAEPLKGAYERLFVERVRELSGEAGLSETIDRGRGDLLAELARGYSSLAPHQRAV